LSKTKLDEYAKALPGRLRPARSKKRAAETGYFLANAVALGDRALEIEVYPTSATQPRFCKFRP